MNSLAPACYTAPLTPPYCFEPTDFLGLAAFAEGLEARNTTPLKVSTKIAAYKDEPQKRTLCMNALAEDRAQYEAAVTVARVDRDYPSARGGVGLVVSSMQNASQNSQGKMNAWHTVGMLRIGKTVWIYNPAYTRGSAVRLRLVPGVANVQRLLDRLGDIQMIQIGGHGSTAEDCMGQAAMWVDNVVRAPGARAPFALGTFQDRVVTEGWEVIARN